MIVLKGKGLMLRPHDADDESAMIAHFNVAEVHKMLRTPVPFTADDARKRRTTAAPLFVIDINGYAGEIGLHSISRGHKAEMFYSLAPVYWGKGIMSEAVSLITEWAFTEYKLQRIQAYVYSYNPASARTLEKCGFLCEGRLRKDQIKNGHAIDRLIYSKLAS